MPHSAARTGAAAQPEGCPQVLADVFAAAAAGGRPPPQLRMRLHVAVDALAGSGRGGRAVAAAAAAAAAAEDMLLELCLAAPAAARHRGLLAAARLAQQVVASRPAWQRAAGAVAQAAPRAAAALWGPCAPPAACGGCGDTACPLAPQPAPPPPQAAAAPAAAPQGQPAAGEPQAAGEHSLPVCGGLPPSAECVETTLQDTFVAVEGAAEGECRCAALRPEPRAVPFSPYGGAAFVWDDVLCAPCCAALASKAEAHGIQSVRQLVDESGTGADIGREERWIRSDRIHCTAPVLLRCIWRRLRRALREAGALAPPWRPLGAESAPPGIRDAAGGWEVAGPNPRFRIMRFCPGVPPFPVHNDGCARDSTQQHYSGLTLVVYLSDDFRAGRTSFPDAAPSPAAALPACSCPAQGACCTGCRCVVPKVGRALCFDHRATHQGQSPTGGTKYILRTEVLFKRQDAPS
eukprot:TRINITY_DN55705_c0_g1_i1.p1 TRINITY_DN55705_c0_g1~~TRINITY_DN55705_c0_g1_i1.p1  ORF type:complete len:483 (+),score=131.94 TRINITY_DN55705_c0_g1_i1:65-1450(+)